MELKRIAVIRTDFPEKFGIPRQSGLCDTVGRIQFVPPYRDERAVRGLEGFSHLWLLWRFDVPPEHAPRLTARPPRLDGQKEMGIFATRSPYRPNPIGLSSVKLLQIVHAAEGPELIVSGADLMDGTEIFDIKPYLSFTDSHPDAAGGFTAETAFPELTVRISEELLSRFPEEKRKTVLQFLSQDPRPAYERKKETPYGISYAGKDIRFTVKGDVLTVFDVAETACIEKVKGNEASGA